MNNYSRKQSTWYQKQVVHVIEPVSYSEKVLIVGKYNSYFKDENNDWL